jgi:hypothetical protein
MYGTTEALCAALTEQYKPDEPLALIVWTKEDVQDCLAEYHVTEIMAARIVALIDSLDDKHVCGVGRIPSCAFWKTCVRKKPGTVKSVCLPPR